MTRSEKSARLLVGINVLVYLSYGVVFMLAPSWGARQFGIELTTTTALADFRAIYGGLPMGVGLFYAAAFKWRELLLPVVALTGICGLEVALARTYSWLVSGTPNTTMFVFMGLELGGVVWAWSVHRALGGARPAPADGRPAETLRSAGAAVQ